MSKQEKLQIDLQSTSLIKLDTVSVWEGSKACDLLMNSWVHVPFVWQGVKGQTGDLLEKRQQSLKEE